jgi:hypothetical protein
MKFNGVDYVQNMRNLIRFLGHYEDITNIFHDKTGVGNALDDFLNELPYPYEGITFTNKSKSQMINNLIMGIQKKELELPNIPEIRQELDAYEVSTNDLGTMKFSAPSGMHDDIVCALMLAYYGASSLVDGDFRVKIAEELKGNDSMSNFYSDLIEEEMFD